MLTTTEVRRKKVAPRYSRRNRGSGRFGTYVVLCVLASFAMGPLIIFVFNSLKSRADLAAHPLAPPQHFQWSNISTAWEQAGMGRALVNSVEIVSMTVAGTLLVASLAAYAMARLDVPGGRPLMAYLLISSSLPLQLFITPLFYLWTRVGLYDTRVGLALIYVGILSPFATLLMRSFLLGLPNDYEDAARIDGAGERRVLWNVVLPQARPGLLSVALITALGAYNEFLFAVTFIQSPDRLPVSLALFSFRIGGYLQNQVLVNAAGLIMMAPVIALFLLLQRRFVDGMSSSGLVG